MSVPRIGVSVDLVILTIRAGQLTALAWRRDSAPYPGMLALPGGFIRLDEDLPAATARVLADRAGLPSARIHLEQLQTYGYPDRDPTRRAVSVAYLALAPDLPAPDTPQMSWQPVSEMSQMAFDHDRILQDGIERARSKLEYTSLAAAFCRDEFTVAELRRVYEIVWGVRLDPRNFHRKVTGAHDFLVETGAVRSSGGGRPAQVYRRGSAQLLHPPMLRPWYLRPGSMRSQAPQSSAPPSDSPSPAPLELPGPPESPGPLESPADRPPDQPIA